VQTDSGYLLARNDFISNLYHCASCTAIWYKWYSDGTLQ